MYRRNTKTLFAAMGLIPLSVLLAVACGGAPPATEDPGQQALPIPPPSAESIPRSATETAAGRMAEAAKGALAQQLGISVAEVVVQSAEAVDWPDASLGCPLPGMTYAQVLVPGYRVILATGSRTYEYHTDNHDQIILCSEDGRPSLPLIPVKPGEIQDGKPWMPAKRPDVTE